MGAASRIFIRCDFRESVVERGRRFPGHGFDPPLAFLKPAKSIRRAVAR
jgi:hypothetical protein